MTIPCLLIPWLLTSPGHQQPWHWLHKLTMFLPSLKINFNSMQHVNFDEWYKLQIHIYVQLKYLSTKWVKYPRHFIHRRWHHSFVVHPRPLSLSLMAQFADCVARLSGPPDFSRLSLHFSFQKFLHLQKWKGKIFVGRLRYIKINSIPWQS